MGRRIASDRVTIDLPVPAHQVTPLGRRWLTGYEINDSDNLQKPRIACDGMEASLHQFEKLGLAMLWMVRGHPLSHGRLGSEVVELPASTSLEVPRAAFKRAFEGVLAEDRLEDLNDTVEALVNAAFGVLVASAPATLVPGGGHA